MKKRDELLLATEDVGSLPLDDDFDEGRKNVDQAIEDKLSAGLDYPSYPQLLGPQSKPMNMGLQFLIPLSKTDPSIQINGEGARLLSSSIRETSTAVGVERAEYFREYLRDHGLIREVKGVKASVTGPFTLASYIDRRSLMTCGASKPEIVRALAQVLSRSCKRLSDLGFDIINIDEPFLCVMLGHKVLFKYDEKFVVEMLNLLIHEVSSLSAVHVCGVVTPLVKKVLLQTDVDMVDHEFAGTPRNVHAYSRDDFERTGKLLAYGCVSSVSPQVETPQEISESITTALSIFGPRIVVKPDCGFAGMKGVPEAYRIAIMKLKNMVQAARTVASAKS